MLTDSKAVATIGVKKIDATHSWLIKIHPAALQTILTPAY